MDEADFRDHMENGMETPRIVLYMAGFSGYSMTELIAMLSTGKGSWAQLFKIIRAENWEKIYLITNSFGKEKYTPDEKTELIAFDFNKEPHVLRDEILSALKERVKGLEVALNMCSGTGKEHMALLSAVLKLGTGIRMVDLCDGRLDEL